MNANEQFNRDCEIEIERMGLDEQLLSKATEFIQHSSRHKYSYHFTWMGRPVIQYPQDIVAMQELIWSVQPELIIETGVAHGGSLILYASILELIGKGNVIGVDIEIRPHNRKAMEEHSMFKRITLIEGSSIADNTVQQVQALARGKSPVMVLLDSNHTEDHVVSELNHYAPLVTVGSYLVVFDTIIERMPEDSFPDRPWGKGNNPMTAVRKFLAGNAGFVVDEAMHNKLLITVAPGGYLRRVA
jgi:cephalosporin hydroxylase